MLWPFIWFLETRMEHVVEILPHEGREPVYRQIANISHTKSQNLNDFSPVFQFFSPIHWNQVLSRERCSWSSAERRCSNYIWAIINLLPTKVRLILDVWRYITYSYWHGCWWPCDASSQASDTMVLAWIECSSFDTRDVRIIHCSL